MSRARFWLRWSLRDLRERWLLVLAIALTIALGTGCFAGMVSTTIWRRDAIDASTELLRMHDLKVELAEGAAVPEGSLRALADALADPHAVAAVSERLVVPVAVDASTDAKTILVPGGLIGVELADGGPAVDGIEPDAGRALATEDDGTPTALLEYRFARFHELAPEGTLVVSGRQMSYVGQASTPEMFLVITGGGAMMADASFAGVFSGLGTAQDIAGMPGLVNDLVLRIAPGADRTAVASDLERTAARLMPGIGVQVLTRDDDPAYRVLVGDIDGDARFFALFAVLILVGAAFAAFNLTSRIVDAQRRQIGIGMALGLPARWLALRPLLMGAEIAVLGVILGLGVGLLFNAWMLALLEQLMPLPVFEAPLIPGSFLGAAVIGFAVPFAGTLLPVRRAIRMPPVEAIHAGPRSVRGSGLAHIASRLPLPRGTFARSPFRNLLRAPRRSLLTVLGIAAAIGVLVSMAAMIDSFDVAIRQGEAATVGDRADRVTVGLAGFLPGSSVDAALATEPAVGSSAAGLRVGAIISSGDREIEVRLDLIDVRGSGWLPSVVAGTLPDGQGSGPGGILLAEEAARDLGVAVGDEVVLHHPRRTDGTTVDTIATSIRVTGLHPNPIRSFAYLDLADAELLGLEGLVNMIDAVPAAGVSQSDLIRAAFAWPGVASAEPVSIEAQVYSDVVEEFVGILAIIEGVALLLALLVAFNSASIATDERSREHATMLAFGVPLRRVLGIEIAECVMLGVVGTIIGLGTGMMVTAWFLFVELPVIMPEVGIPIAVAPGTVLVAAIVGVVVVGLAPLLMTRRLRRMDLPGTLRLVE